MIIIVTQLRNRPANNSTANLESTIALLKADLIGRQSESLVAIRDSIDRANTIVSDRLADGTQSLDKRMAIFSEIENKLGALSKQTANIETVGNNIQSLSDLLRPPKVRGMLGELLLENLLGQILPKNLYEMQYGFSDGSRVDAIVRLGDSIVPIDSKFPLEAWQRISSDPDDKKAEKDFATAMKKHIDAISSRYIKQGEKTTDFAIMYIPAESVYYQLLVNDSSDSFEYALKNKVIPSSPGHFYGFLSSVAAIYSELSLARSMAGSDGKRIANGIADLLESAGRLNKLYARMEGSIRSLGSSMEKSRSEIVEIETRLARLKEPEIENDLNSSTENRNLFEN